MNYSSLEEAYCAPPKLDKYQMTHDTFKFQVLTTTSGSFGIVTINETTQNRSNSNEKHKIVSFKWKVFPLTLGKCSWGSISNSNVNMFVFPVVATESYFVYVRPTVEVQEQQHADCRGMERFTQSSRRFDQNDEIQRDIVKNTTPKKGEKLFGLFETAKIISSTPNTQPDSTDTKYVTQQPSNEMLQYKFVPNSRVWDTIPVSTEFEFSPNPSLCAAKTIPAPFAEFSTSPFADFPPSEEDQPKNFEDLETNLHSKFSEIQARYLVPTTTTKQDTTETTPKTDPQIPVPLVWNFSSSPTSTATQQSKSDEEPQYSSPKEDKKIAEGNKYYWTPVFASSTTDNNKFYGRNGCCEFMPPSEPFMEEPWPKQFMEEPKTIDAGWPKYFDHTGANKDIYQKETTDCEKIRWQENRLRSELSDRIADPVQRNNCYPYSSYTECTTSTPTVKPSPIVHSTPLTTFDEYTKYSNRGRNAYGGLKYADRLKAKILDIRDIRAKQLQNDEPQILNTNCEINNETKKEKNIEIKDDSQEDDSQ